MIQLHPDYLLFELPNGDSVPCSAETVTFELIGEAAENLDPNVIKNAAAAVLHYFHEDLKRDHVSMGEFSEALEQVLRGFGFQVHSDSSAQPEPAPKSAPVKPEPAEESNLEALAQRTGDSGDLFFFTRLREEVRQRVHQSAAGRVHFSGLRPCVKRLLGAARWSRRCEGKSDEIVSYVRQCLSNETEGRNCAVVIR